MKARYLNNNYSSIASTLAGAGIGALAGAGVGGLVHAMTKEEAFEEYKKICKNTNQEPTSREEFYKSDLCKKMVVGGLAGAGIGGIGGFIQGSMKDEKISNVKSKIEAEKILQERKSRLAAPQSDKLSPTKGPSSPSGGGSGPNGSGSQGGLPGGGSPNPTNGPNDNSNNTTADNRTWTQGPSNTSYDEDGNPTGFVSRHTAPDNSKKEGKVFRNEGGKDPLGKSGASSNNNKSTNTQPSGKIKKLYEELISETKLREYLMGVDERVQIGNSRQKSDYNPMELVGASVLNADLQDIENDESLSDEDKKTVRLGRSFESRFIGMTNKENLSDEEKMELEELFKSSPQIQNYLDRSTKYKHDKIVKSRLENIDSKDENKLKEHNISPKLFIEATMKGLNKQDILKALDNGIPIAEIEEQHEQGNNVSEYIKDVVALSSAAAVVGSRATDEDNNITSTQTNKIKVPKDVAEAEIVEMSPKTKQKKNTASASTVDVQSTKNQNKISVPKKKSSTTPKLGSVPFTNKGGLSTAGVHGRLVKTPKVTVPLVFSHNLFEIPNSMGINKFFSKSFTVEDEYGDKVEIKEKKARDIALKLGLAGVGGIGGFVGEDYIPGIGDLSVGPIDVGGTVLGSVGLNSGIVAADKIVDNLYTREAIKKLDDLKLSRGEYQRLLTRNGIKDN